MKGSKGYTLIELKGIIIIGIFADSAISRYFGLTRKVAVGKAKCVLGSNGVNTFTPW